MKKRLFVFVPLFFISLLLITIFSPLITMSEDISQKVLRMHIVANSDNIDDQDLKLQIRDDILDYSKDLFKNCNSLDESIALSTNNIKQIENIANLRIKKCGKEYQAKVYVTNEFFDTRYYDSFTLPAGYYNTIKIVLGKGIGHNWWCVMYPSVCISGCTDDFDSELSKEEIRFVTNNGYKIAFKSVEIIERFKYVIKNKS